MTLFGLGSILAVAQQQALGWSDCVAPGNRCYLSLNNEGRANSARTADPGFN